jgi:hypothetical protein
VVLDEAVERAAALLKAAPAADDPDMNPELAVSSHVFFEEFV